LSLRDLPDLSDGVVARMKAAGRNPGRSTVVIFFNARPGFHPGYNSTAVLPGGSVSAGCDFAVACVHRCAPRRTVGHTSCPEAVPFPGCHPFSIIVYK
jgi:hypothetical protein